jgi:glycosyltransferase involved in cell wall biosynthesis
MTRGVAREACGAAMTDRGLLISVGMPVRNSRETLPRAVQSIRWQTYAHWELILIDDGSDDGTREIAAVCAEADGRVRVVADGEHRGTSYRLNQAIALSRGALFARMDGDDVSYPERFERQVGYLRRHPDVDLVGAGAVVFGDDGAAVGKRVGPERHEAICARPYAGVPVMQPAFLGRIEFFRRYGYAVGSVRDGDRALFARAFPDGLEVVPGGLAAAEDQDLLMRAHRAARFANVPEILIGYREAGLRLGKIASQRRCFVKSLRRRLWAGGAPLSFAFYTCLQLGKMTYDCAAVATGLNYRLLRHRARPVTREERERWDALWARLGREGLGRLTPG